MAPPALNQLTEDQIRNLPLEDLEALVMQRSSELATMTGGMDPMQGEMSAPTPEGGSQPIEPDALMAATAVLVEAGLLPSPTSDLTPEIIAALQSFVDKLRPGLYDLSIPQDLSEVIDGIANGTIGLEPAGPAAGGLPPGGPDGGAPIAGLPAGTSPIG